MWPLDVTRALIARTASGLARSARHACIEAFMTSFRMHSNKQHCAQTTHVDTLPENLFQDRIVPHLDQQAATALATTRRAFKDLLISTMLIGNKYALPFAAPCRHSSSVHRIVSYRRSEPTNQIDLLMNRYGLLEPTNQKNLLMNKLYKLLPQTIKLEVLDLSLLELDGLIVGVITTLGKTSIRLRELNIKRNLTTRNSDTALRLVAAMFTVKHDRLETLRMGDNCLAGIEAGTTLGNFIAVSPALKEFDLSAAEGAIPFSVVNQDASTSNRMCEKEFLGGLYNTILSSNEQKTSTLATVNFSQIVSSVDMQCLATKNNFGVGSRLFGTTMSVVLSFQSLTTLDLSGSLRWGRRASVDRVDQVLSALKQHVSGGAFLGFHPQMT